MVALINLTSASAVERPTQIILSWMDAATPIVLNKANNQPSPVPAGLGYLV